MCSAPLFLPLAQVDLGSLQHLRWNPFISTSIYIDVYIDISYISVSNM